MGSNSGYRPWLLLALAVALAWAAFTGHVWEDYYITYRASKNLAVGAGLTFTAGERVHSFTSPLGVLLPALASLLTGNRSDTAALWIFRVMSALALGGAVAMVVAAVRHGAERAGAAAAALIAAFILTDAKILDYTVNGMETALMLFFIGWAFWALVTEPRGRPQHLGLAWAGMMWTRPDAFIYIAALGLGALAFRPAAEFWRGRARFAGEMIRAGLVTTVAYLPWLLWAWWYYGSPVPHTIVAKGTFVPKVTPGLMVEWLVALPGKMWTEPRLLAGTFMPAYSHDTGWPAWAAQLSAGLAVLAMVAWLVPRVRWEARVASFGAAVGQYYLQSFVGFPVPWYMPMVTLLSWIALGLVLAQGFASGIRIWAWAARAAAAGLLAGAVLLSGAAAWQLRCQQRIVEDGHRRQIGAWLKAQAASPRDTVFLEPLGYIGFYSNLKMLDFPGLSAPEVVAARRRAESRAYPFSWSEVIMDLQPDWLVLRPFERESIEGRDPEVLTRFYERTKVFDVRGAVAAVKFLPGRKYLEGDACFEVYHRRAGLPPGVSIRRVRESMLTKRQAWNEPAYDSGLYLMAHAPSSVEFPLPSGARWLTGGYGFLAGAFERTDPTDGAGFSITHVSGSGERTVLLQRTLRPAAMESDRPEQAFRVELPEGAGGRIELQTTVGDHGSNAFDWTHWSDLRLETPRGW